MTFEVGDQVQVNHIEPWFAGAVGTIAAEYPEVGLLMVQLEPFGMRAPNGLTLPFTAEELDRTHDGGPTDE